MEPIEMRERGNRLIRWLDRYMGVPLAGLTTCMRLGCQREIPVEPKRVGVLCLGAIGDLLLLSGLINGLRRRLPSARLELLVSPANTAAVPLIPNIDGHASFDVRHVPYLVAYVRRRHYDVLVDSSQWARLGALVCNLSGAACTVGFATPGQYRALGYSLKVEHRADRHELENFLALGRALFPDLSGEPLLRLPADMPRDAAQLPGELGRRRAFCHMWPSGYKAFLKEWTPRHWELLIRKLTERGFSVYLTGGPSDAGRNEVFLRERLPLHPHVFSLAGKMSLSGLAWLLARADAAISVNTGTMHLAALVGAPTVGLHGATNPLRWGPIGPRTISLLPRQGQAAYLNLGFEYPDAAYPSLMHLSVEDVLAALTSLGSL